MNLEIEKFHEDLINLINESQLPAGAIFYIMKDCLGEIANAYRASLRQPQIEEEK